MPQSAWADLKAYARRAEALSHRGSSFRRKAYALIAAAARPRLLAKLNGRCYGAMPRSSIRITLFAREIDVNLGPDLITLKTDTPAVGANDFID